MPFNIIRQDIVNIKADAIVCAGNSDLRGEGGVSGAIFRAAGEKELQAFCSALAPIETAQAVVTPGFKLNAKYIIHTLGPVYSAHSPEISEALLKECYENVLSAALGLNCESIALPLISAGNFRFPKDRALEIARNTIRDFLKYHDMEICLAVYGSEDFRISQELMGDVRSYIDQHYVEEHFLPRNSSRRESVYGTYKNCDRTFAPEAASFNESSFYEQDADFCTEAPRERIMSAPQAKAPEDKKKSSSKKPAALPDFESLEDCINSIDESFSRSLLRLIDLKGKTDVEVYKKANMDRKLFSKIRSNPSYSPSKKTVLALAVALELSLPETESLLEKAGYSLSHSIMSDVIVEFFIVKGIYDIFTINEVLFSYDQALL